MDNNPDIIYDHYKESFDLSKKAQAQRDKYFAISIILIAILFLLFIEPNTTVDIGKSILKEKLDLDVKYSVSVIQSFIWFLLMYYTMRYYQRVIYVERQYHYIHKIEETLRNQVDKIFDREGDNYLNNYPAFGNFIEFIYKYIFPVLHFLIISIKIISEWKVYESIYNVILNTAIAVIINIMTFLYIIFLHPKLSTVFKRRPKNEKELIPE